MKQIPLRGKHANGRYAIVDDEDYNRVSLHNWWLGKNGYVYSRVRSVSESKDKKFLLHRYILGLIDPSPFVDHINDDKLDNRRINLRLCSNKQNVSKKRKLSGFSSLYKGVSWEKRVNRWRVTITHNYKQIHIGTFDSEIEASKAYDIKAMEVFGDYARLNNA